MAYVSASPLLSNRVRYPNFYRTYTSDALIAPAFVQLVKSFGWKRIMIITENEPLFSGVCVNTCVSLYINKLCVLSCVK